MPEKDRKEWTDHPIIQTEVASAAMAEGDVFRLMRRTLVTRLNVSSSPH